MIDPVMQQSRQPRRDAIAREKLCNAKYIVRVGFHRVHSDGFMNVNVDEAGKKRKAIEINYLISFDGLIYRRLKNACDATIFNQQAAGVSNSLR